MKILFVSESIPPDNSAVANIIRKIVPIMQAENCHVDALTVRKSYCDKAVDEQQGMTVFRADHIIYAPKKKCYRDYADALVKRIRTRTGVTENCLFDEFFVRSLVKKLEQIHVGQYDVIIPVCAYYDTAEAVLRYNEKTTCTVPVILYQLDPLTENSIYQSMNHEELAKYERKLYSKCAAVFTTPIIAKRKAEEGWQVEHVIAVEFPALQKPETSKAIPKENSEIRCVFAGYLYEGIRNPEYTLRLFSKMENPNIHLYILGTGQERILDEYAKGALAGRLHLIGPVPEDDCNAWLNSADILVNIGNTITNQVPSKIINYMGFCKPILNICKSSQCPTIPYMDKYPLAVTLVESNSIANDLLSAVESKLLSMIDKKLTFDEVKRIMYTCTPDYVAKKICAAITQQGLREEV